MKQPGPEEINIRLAAAIRNRRVLVGKSQQVLGKAAGVTFQQIQKYENGKNQMSVVRAVQIANALGWTLTELLAAALDEPAVTAVGSSDRATLEFTKRFAMLKENERRGVVLLVNNLAAAV